MSLWITGAIGIAVACIGITYIKFVKDKRPDMNRARVVVIALAILGIAFNELMVVPVWGVEAGNSVSSAFFMCVILPLAAYLGTKRKQ